MKALSDCRLLLVDDARANLDILVEGLKSEYKLSLAWMARWRCSAAARSAPDLVLLDIMMPGIDGYEVCRRLRRARHRRRADHLPVLAGGRAAQVPRLRGRRE
jgi:CheY-like chemotaxis protein